MDAYKFTKVQLDLVKMLLKNDDEMTIIEKDIKQSLIESIASSVKPKCIGLTKDKKTPCTKDAKKGSDVCGCDHSFKVVDGVIVSARSVESEIKQLEEKLKILNAKKSE